MKPERIISIHFICICFVFVSLLFRISSAEASLWQLDATARFPSIGYSDFWITFNDGDNDDIVSFTDIVEFSGVYLGDDWPDSNYPFQVVTAIPTPTLTMPTTDGGIVNIPALYNGISTFWTFTRTGSYSESRNIGGSSGDMYNYTATETVPLPSAVWLLGAGLIGVVGIRRKFKE